MEIMLLMFGTKNKMTNAEQTWNREADTGSRGEDSKVSVGYMLDRIGGLEYLLSVLIQFLGIDHGLGVDL